ncbi:MAG TPA: branched-chain amino acid ABC transporter permease [Acidimicrobiales bacterium]|nr:branched-chain amino acid ABC transporter permease [Acidimicrobiales bacterium]
MHIFLSAVGFAIVDAAILSIVSMGFSLQFGMTNVLNLAFGPLMSLGALIAFYLNENGVFIWYAALIGALAVGLTSLFLGQTIFRTFARKGSRLFEMAIVSIAVGLVIDNAMAAITHSTTYQFNFPLGSNHDIGGMTFTTTELIIILIAAVTIASLEYVLHRTRLGVAIRASSANANLALASGIRTERVLKLTWIISGVLCGLGGVVLAISYMSINYTTGDTYLPYVLTAVIVAGIGAIGYAAIAAFILSLVVEVAGAYGAAAYNIMIAIGILLIMLLVRPRGFFSELWERVEVTA